MTFQKELETYQSALPNWMEEEGRWTLILGSEIAGVFDTREEATDYGYDKYGLAHFMVKQIHQVEPVYSMGSLFMRVR